MRTTISLEDDLLAEAKQAAARSGRTVSQVVEDALREVFARRRAASEQPPLRFHSVDGDGPLPGVTVNSNAALFDLMDHERSPGE